MSATLENTKVGDMLVFSRHGSLITCKVDKVTANFVICGGTKFNREGRSTSGDVWHRVYVRPITQEDRDKMHLAKLIREVNEMCRGDILQKYPLVNIEHIHRILTEGKPK